MNKPIIVKGGAGSKFTPIYNGIFNGDYNSTDVAVFCIAEHLKVYDGNKDIYNHIAKRLSISADEVEQSWNRIANVGKGDV